MCSTSTVLITCCTFHCLGTGDQRSRYGLHLFQKSVLCPSTPPLTRLPDRQIIDQRPVTVSYSNYTSWPGLFAFQRLVFHGTCLVLEHTHNETRKTHDSTTRTRTHPPTHTHTLNLVLVSYEG